MRGKRLSRLERPATLGRGNPLSALFIRPDGQTEDERIEFDAAVRKHLAKGGAVSVFDENDIEGIAADSARFLG